MSAQAIAIVGLACRYPDAPDPQSLWDLVLSGRRAFRRIPPGLFDLDDYFNSDRGRPDTTYSTRAALIEGWEPGPDAGQLPGQPATDPAHRLAVETAAHALEDAGFAAGQGLDHDRTGVIVGNSIAGRHQRALAIRLHWPNVRRILAGALADARGGGPEGWHGDVLDSAGKAFLAAFPEITPAALADGLTSTIADVICANFRFRGGGHAVDGICASSLLALATACTALTAGDLDFALAGGVDIGLGPVDLIGLAKTGALATDEVRIYDAAPTGYLPGEGCGIVALMRAGDAHAMGVPVYADIIGWGLSSAGTTSLTRPGPDGLLLALRRAYQRAGADPAQVQLIEGHGAGTAAGDLAELTALTTLREGDAGRPAAIGSIKANIGHTRAAAGVAGLLKAVLAMSSGTLPPTTGCAHPHPLLLADAAPVRMLAEPQHWPAGPRLAGVTAMGAGGTNVHVVLCRADSRAERRARTEGAVEPGARAGGHTADTDGAIATDGVITAGGAIAAAGITAGPGRARARLGTADGADRTGMRTPAQPPGTVSATHAPATTEPPSTQAPPSTAGPAGQTRTRAEPSSDVSSPPVSANGVPAVPAPSMGSGWRTLRGSAAGAPGGTGLIRGGPGTLVYAFSGDDPAKLAAYLRRVADLAPWLTDSERHDLACQQARRSGKGRMRTAFAAGSAAQLAERARRAAQLAPVVTPGVLHHERGVFAGDNVRGRVVLLFPGHSHPATGKASGPGANAATWQQTVNHASCAALRWLDRLGVTAAAAIGHSLGEITALTWAGCLTEAEAARLVERREHVVAMHCSPGTAMLSVAADTATARTLAEDSGLVIAAYNGPRAHVLAGLGPAVRAAVERAAARGISVTRLPAARAFHSPAMNGCAAALRPALDSITFGAPRRRLISTVTGRELRPDDDIRGLLCEQLIAPVRFHEAVRAAAPGADLFCAAGPGRILARLAVQCCQVPAVSVGGGAGGSGAGGDDTTAANAAAALFASGAAATLRPVFDGRAARPIDIWRERVFITDPGMRELRDGELTAARNLKSAGGPKGAAGPKGAGGPKGARGPAATQAGTVPPGTSKVSAAADTAGTRPAPDRPAPPSAPGAPRTGQEAQPAAAGAARTHPAPDHPAPDHPAPSSAPGASRTRQEPQPAAAGTMRNHPAPDHPAPDHPAPAGAPGVAAWIRCFTEVTRPLAPEPTATASGPWLVRVIGRQPFGESIGETFMHDASARCVLAFVADSGDPDAGRLLDAAREGIGCGRLVVLTHGAGLAGFCRALHAEHPELGITLLLVPEGRAGLRLARGYATAEPGTFREITFASGGPAPLATALTPLTVTGAGGTPLGPADVVLLTGGTDRIMLVCAEALASTGAAVAMIGGIEPAGDPALRAGLERLRARACAAYESADMTDATTVRAAVRKLEERLGPVTALVHASAAGSPRAFSDLNRDDVRTKLAAATAGLAGALAAIRPGRLRLVVTFGWVAGRFGLAGGCHHALASGVLREQTQRLARRAPACRILHIEWPPWSGVGTSPRGRGGNGGDGGWITPIKAAEAGQLLVRLAATADLPSVIAVHGRVGLAPAVLPAAIAPSRFLAEVQVHYPGVELVTDATLGPQTDPYLADYRPDGVAVLPAVVGLEAMAQAASALAGQPLRRAEDVRFGPPVGTAADGKARVRVCALHHGDAVEAVLRSAASGYRIEHARAVFPVPGGGAQASGQPDGSAQASGQPDGARPRQGGLLDGTGTGIVDGSDLYGPLLPHTGRLRRVALLPELTSDGCRALIRGSDDTPWFALGGGDGPLILGSPGVNDACLQVLQACMPHRRLVPAGCESISAAGRTVTGVVEASARARRSGATGQVWDVAAVDGDGDAVVTWSGVRLADAGPLRRNGPWPPSLLAVYLEQGAAALGLGPDLRVTVLAGYPGELWRGQAGSAGAITGAAGPADASHADGPRHTRRGQADSSCRSHLDGLILTVETAGPAACAWEAAQGRRKRALPAAPEAAALREALRERLAEPPATVAARIWTAFECLVKARRPTASPLVLGETRDDGWVLLRAGEASMASTVVEVSGVAGPVAVAIMTAGAPAPETDCRATEAAAESRRPGRENL